MFDKEALKAHTMVCANCEKLKSALVTQIGNRKLYVLVVPTKTNKKEVQFFYARNFEIHNATREVGIVTGRKFSKDNRKLIVTDVEMVAEDLSDKLGCGKLELIRL